MAALDPFLRTQSSVPRTPGPDQELQRLESPTSFEREHPGDGTALRHGLSATTAPRIRLHPTSHALQIAYQKTHNLAIKKGRGFRRIFCFSFLSFPFFPQKINETERGEARLVNPLSSR